MMAFAESATPDFSFLYPLPKTLRPKEGTIRLDLLGFPLEIAKKYDFLFARFAVSSRGRGSEILMAEDRRLAEEEYRIETDAKRIVLTFASEKGQFYALSTLLQIVSFFKRRPSAVVPGFVLHDYPDIAFRGFLLDVSRGAVPHLTVLQELMLQLALLKVNHFSLYIEDSLLCESADGLNLKKSVITKTEIAQLSALAKKTGIEFFPSFQSLCHLGNLLKHPVLKPLAARASSECIDPGKKESVQFIKRFTSEIADAFPSKLVNIGMDECERLGSPGDHLAHFLEMYRFFKSKGKRVAVWGDMFLKHPETVKKIPSDVLILNWNYFVEREDDFAKSARPFRHQHLRQVLCPATWSWAKYLPAANKSIRNATAAYQAARKEKLEGAMLTSWGDDGNEYLLKGIALALFYAGNLFWSGQPAKPDPFALWTGGENDPNLFRIFTFLARIDEPLPYTHRYYLLEDPIFAPFSRQDDAAEIIARYEKAADYLEKRGGGQTGFTEYFRFAGYLYLLIAEKVAFSSHLLPRLIQNQDEVILADSRRLLAQLSDIKNRYSRLWMGEYKSEGLFGNLMKLTRIEERLHYLGRVLGDRRGRENLLFQLTRYSPDPVWMSVDSDEIFNQ